MSFFYAGKKRERRLKQTAKDVDEVEEDEEDETAEADSSDPMMGFTFNECKLVCVREIYRSALWLHSLRVHCV